MSKGKITRIDAIRILRMYMKQNGISYEEALAELNRDFDIVSAQPSQPVVRVKGIANDTYYPLAHEPGPDPALAPHRLPEAYNIVVDVGVQGSDRSAYSIVSEYGYVLGTTLTKEEAFALMEVMLNTERYKGDLGGGTSGEPAEEISRFDLIDI